MKRASVKSYSLNLSHFERLRAGIESRTAKVGVIGRGYVSLPLALLFSEQKFPVTGFDIDRQKVEVLEAGRSYIHRTGPRISIPAGYMP
jgi:UDP-N-acetyl-D-glucosamine dehydrogenase